MARPHTAPLAAVFAALATLAGPALAEPLSTDRPDFVESSDVVGRGRVQVETSLAFERDRADGLRTTTASTPTLLRVGAGDTLELRLETDGRLRARSTDGSGLASTQSGWADASLGLKWHQRDGDEKTGSAALAWLLHADLDSGSRPFRGQGVRPSLRFVAEWELPGDVSLGVMPGLFADRSDDGAHYVGGIAAVTLSKGWTERVHSFVEVAGQRIARARNGGSVATFDVGASWLLSDDVQLDTAAFFGLNRNTPDAAWTVGLSVRF